MINLFYRAARTLAWGRAFGKLASGNPLPLARRARNRLYFRLFSRFLR